MDNIMRCSKVEYVVCDVWWVCQKMRRRVEPLIQAEVICSAILVCGQIKFAFSHDK